LDLGAICRFMIAQTIENSCYKRIFALCGYPWMKLHLPNSAHLQNIEGFIRQYAPNGQAGLSVSSDKRYIHVHPAALAMAACAGMTCQQGGISTAGSIAPVSSLPYLLRMKLFDFIGLEPPRTINEHEEAGRFIPLTQIRTSADLKRVLTELVPLLHAAPAAADPIRYVFSELGRNVLEHADSQIGAFLCAQYFREKNRIAIGIADSGVGIFSSIRRSHPAANYSEAINLALTPGISGATPKIGGNETNAGAGLFFIKSIAKISDNYFVIYSGDTLFKLLKHQADTLTLSGDPQLDRHKTVTNLPHWKGTVIGVDISVEEGREFGVLLEQIRKSYSLDVKKRKKNYYKQIKFT
jgi:anti-sigma regulatory factor (Ser/Thr protein kinase)